MSRSSLSLLCGILIGFAVLFVIGHFVLDAGSGREAPGWLLPAALVCALGGVFTGVAVGRGRR